ncbi:hypothetical protein BLNAU_5443 [Blattamonas nauphoetae]|uniref:Uncharacterized protein n=1 Tax=Blattamonas nauphoetae TaxID=2049346 RepID=A0ABQ9Y7B9_9EUKA|nr:hypothetical protein BLNAU_5443 [Blattamonas nauphoetae]
MDRTLKINTELMADINLSLDEVIQQNNPVHRQQRRQRRPRMNPNVSRRNAQDIRLNALRQRRAQPQRQMAPQVIPQNRRFLQTWSPRGQGRPLPPPPRRRPGFLEPAPRQQFSNRQPRPQPRPQQRFTQQERALIRQQLNQYNKPPRGGYNNGTQYMGNGLLPTPPQQPRRINHRNHIQTAPRRAIAAPIQPRQRVLVPQRIRQTGGRDIYVVPPGSTVIQGNLGARRGRGRGRQ